MLFGKQQDADQKIQHRLQTGLQQQVGVTDSNSTSEQNCLCIDYSSLKDCTTKDAYLLPCI